MKKDLRPNDDSSCKLKCKRKTFAEKRQILDAGNNDDKCLKFSKKKKIVEFRKSARTANGAQKRKKLKRVLDEVGVKDTGEGKRNLRRKKKDNNNKCDAVVVVGVKKSHRRRRDVATRHVVGSKDPMRTVRGDPDRQEDMLEEDDLFFHSDNENDLPADNMDGEESDSGTDTTTTTTTTTHEDMSDVVRERMWEDKMRELKHTLCEIQNKTLPRYVQGLNILKQQKEDWVRMAHAHRDEKMREIERDYEEDLKEIFLTELDERRRIIEEERYTLKLTQDLPSKNSTKVTRKLRRRTNEPPPPTEKKRKTVRIDYRLCEEDILKDLQDMNGGGVDVPVDDNCVES